MGKNKGLKQLLMATLSITGITVSQTAWSEIYPSRKPMQAGVEDASCTQFLDKNRGCVFFKNPIYSSQSPIDLVVGYNFYEALNSAQTTGPDEEAVDLLFSGSLTATQTYSVEIKEDSLVNNTFRMGSANSGDSSTQVKFEDSWVRPLDQKFGLQVSFASNEVNTYYWANRQATIVKDLVGTYYGEDKQVLIDSSFFMLIMPMRGADGQPVNNPVTGQPMLNIKPFENAAWSPFDNQVLIGTAVNGQSGISLGKSLPLALDSGIVAHELGHSMMTFATNNSVNRPSLLDMECGEDGKSVCSETFRGSPRAIGEGVGDVVTYIIFGDTAIGEMFENTLVGLTGACGAPRNAKDVKELGLTAKDMYASCEFATGRPTAYDGAIHDMGAIYSRVWYGILKKAEARGLERKAQQLFFEHIKLLTSKDNFLSAKSMIKMLNSRVFGGQFTQEISAEFSAVGL